ncbi:MAG: 50S ribosomal protein L17 [Chloroflexi bacterium]|jgi:large subunit ribosomal protein L17|nr:50S ribosomal protein L17 [Chloroflexota bacterium]
MRHRAAGRHLGRDSAHRVALFRNLMTELFRHERIKTTRAKALSIRSEAEHLVTVAKNGKAKAAAEGTDVHERRQAASVLRDPAVVKKLFDEIAPRFQDRPGGYTRVVKLGPRLGDGAEMVMLELVD